MVDKRKDGIIFNIGIVSKTDYSSKYKVTIGIPLEYGWIDPVSFVVEKDWKTYYYKLNHLKNDNGIAYFEGEVELDAYALYRYYFETYINGNLRLIKKEDITIHYYEEYYENGIRKLRKITEALNNQEIAQDEMWKLSVNYEVPRWAMGKIMYHIFVDRFYRGSKEPMQEMPRRHIHKSWNEEVMLGPDENGIWNNDFFGGDLKGIIDKLDYIKSLGVTILYISPVMYSQSTHRYDTSNFEIVDPYAGCNKDLKKLCDEAHRRGMKVILDAVFNHTGSDSKYFNRYHNLEWELEDGLGAYYDENSKYAKFYKKVWDNEKKKFVFKYWWGHENLPECDSSSLEWRKYILAEGGVIDKWFSLGIDGLRLDVADELSDEFIELIRIAVKRNKKDGFIIGEVWENPMTKDNRGYLKNGKGMDAVMNYDFVSPILSYFRYGNISELAYKIREIMNGYPDGAIFSGMNFTSTHDITRGINLWDSNIFYGRRPWDLISEDLNFIRQYTLTDSDYQKAKEQYMSYVFCLAFMPGTLSVFYGDEVGLQGIGNLNNRKPFPWGHEDKEILEFFKMIGRIRNSETFLEDADLRIHDINFNYIAFERFNNQDSTFVIVSRSNQQNRFYVPEIYQKPSKIYTLKKSKLGILNPYGAIAIKK